MPEFHNVNTFKYDSTAISRVQSVQWSKVGAGVQVLVDGSGAQKTKSINPTAVQGTVVLLDSTEAAKLASKVALTKNVTFLVTDTAGAVYTVTIVNIVTSPILGGANALASEGPHVVQFGADSVSNPVAV